MGKPHLHLGSNRFLYYHLFILLLTKKNALFSFIYFFSRGPVKIDPPPVDVLMMDQFGNYVVQKVIKTLTFVIELMHFTRTNRTMEIRTPFFSHNVCTIFLR